MFMYAVMVAMRHRKVYVSVSDLQVCWRSVIKHMRSGEQTVA
jgi:hypothetical protein